jgi:transaldolase
MASGELQSWIDRGVRGMTSNPSIFAKAMSDTSDYDDQLESLVKSGLGVTDAYWRLVVADINQALDLLAPVHEASGGEDGYVSVEVAPELANDEVGTVEAARALHDRIDAPNLYVKVPGTAEGVPAVQTLISEQRSINVTLIFSLERYKAVMEAYLAGLESVEGDLSHISSVASFFISRVDVEIDRRLDDIGTDRARSLKGKAALAQGKLAYQLFLDAFTGDRWAALSARNARLQRPLWASTSTKDPSYSDTLYVDNLIGPNTVNTLPDDTLVAFEDHGSLSRTLDFDVDQARQVVVDLAELGIELEEVAATLETEGVAGFAKSFDEALDTLGSRAADVD